ncbi:MAG: restriction endonuclease [Tenericutes bacterium]|nr:restriction endonuclease [Mycoplasmatota bacterium]
MVKQKKEENLEDIIEKLYFFLKYKLHFDDFQASTVIISLCLFPISLLLGFNGTSGLYAFKVLFYLLILLDFCCIVYSVLKIRNIKKNRTKSKSINIKDINTIRSIEEVDLLSGIEFEFFIEKIFKDRGYKTTITKASHDGGADVLAEKGNDLICIQAKRKSKNINKYPVFDAYHAQKPFNANKACIATNRELTEQAKNFAHYLDVEILDRYKIMAILRKRNNSKSVRNK